jgi:hypothetical protein
MKREPPVQQAPAARPARPPVMQPPTPRVQSEQAVHDPSLEAEADALAERASRVRATGWPAAPGNGPLEPRARDFFEARFGHDFSRVRVYDDASANARAQILGAMAFTQGQHVAFARGLHAPHTERGWRLLAHELAHVAQQQRGAVTGVMCKPQTAGSQPLLIDIARIDGVWSDFVLREARRLKQSPDSAEVRAAAEVLTERQVGPMNHARWKAETRPATITLDPARQARAEIDIEAQLAAERLDALRLPNGEPWSPDAEHAWQIEQADLVAKRMLALQGDVADMERDALKLKTPDGLQGKVYQYGGGGIGLVVSPTLGTASKMMSLPVQALIERVQGKEGGPTVGSIAEQGVADAVTAYQLTSGDLNAIYLDTRTHYDAFISATRDLNTARAALKRAQRLEDRAAAAAQLRSALRRSVDAYAAYAMGCQLAGIPGKAANLEAMIDDTAEGVVFALETAATLPLGAGLGGKQARALLRQGEQAIDDAARAGAGVLDDMGRAAAPKSAPVAATSARRPAAGEAAKQFDALMEHADDLAPANDNALLPRQPQVMQATGTDDVATGIDDMVEGAAGGSGDAVVASGGKMAPDVARYLKVNRIARQVGLRVERATPSKADLAAADAYYAQATPQLGGTAGHVARGMAPKGPDIVSIDTVGELKMVRVVTRGTLESAFEQVTRYARRMRKKKVMIRVMDMTNGAIYDFYPL